MVLLVVDSEEISATDWEFVGRVIGRFCVILSLSESRIGVT